LKEKADVNVKLYQEAQALRKSIQLELRSQATNKTSVTTTDSSIRVDVSKRSSR